MKRSSAGGIIVVWVMVLLGIGPVVCGSGGQSPDETKSEFEQRYQALREYVTSEGVSVRDPLLTGEGWTLYLRITELGPPALPYIIEKIEEGDWRLGGCVSMITKKRFNRSDYADVRYYGDARTKARMYVDWWHEGRKETRQESESLYQERKAVAQQGEHQAAADTYRKMRGLGIAALPWIIEKVEQRDVDLIPLVSGLTSGLGGASDAISSWASTTECLEWWNKNKQSWTLPPARDVQWAPARWAAAVTGASVYWNEAERAAVFSMDGHLLVVRPGEARATLDGGPLLLEGVPYIENDRLMLPLSALTGAFGVAAAETEPTHVAYRPHE